MGRNVSDDVGALVSFRSHLISFNRTLEDEVARMRWHSGGLRSISNLQDNDLIGIWVTLSWVG